MGKLTIRHATPEDSDFIVEGILAALLSGRDKTVYELMFGISFEEFEEMLHEFVPIDIPYYDWTYLSYCIGEYDGQKVASLCGWVEAAEGTPSYEIRTTMIARHIGIEKMKAARPTLERVKPFSFQRKPMTYQFDYAYMIPDYRGMEIMADMNEFMASEAKDEFPELEVAQNQIYSHNKAMLRLSEKIGFVPKDEIVYTEEVKDIFPFHSLIMSEKPIIYKTDKTKVRKYDLGDEESSRVIS